MQMLPSSQLLLGWWWSRQTVLLKGPVLLGLELLLAVLLRRASSARHRLSQNPIPLTASTQQPASALAWALQLLQFQQAVSPFAVAPPGRRQQQTTASLFSECPRRHCYQKVTQRRLASWPRSVVVAQWFLVPLGLGQWRC